MRVEIPVFDELKGALDLTINSGAYELVSVREEDGVFTIESRRFGHGVGMSQRGAQRMAGQEGFFWTEILNFYYPGMALQKAHFSFVLPTPMSRQFLATPGPAATPTPRPTLMPVTFTPGPEQYKVAVTNIGVNSYLNLRAQPNTQSAVLRQLYYGQELIVTKEAGDWLLVKTDSVSGYVMAQFVEKVP